jgi:hypothetical protein
MTLEYRRIRKQWKFYKGGWAWVLLNCGFPVRARVLTGGQMEEYPYHIGLCTVMSRTRDLKLRHGATRSCDWWTLRNRRGILIAARKTSSGSMFRRLNPKKGQRRSIPMLVVVGAEATALLNRTKGRQYGTGKRPKD